MGQSYIVFGLTDLYISKRYRRQYFKFVGPTFMSSLVIKFDSVIKFSIVI